MALAAVARAGAIDEDDYDVDEMSSCDEENNLTVRHNLPHPKYRCRPHIGVRENAQQRAVSQQ